ncbi:MAG: hypothetical protein MPJ50_08950, partial [Pirellulales bacterium]|nr:hypothetical protein [Pirellulales bacterium]
MNHSWNEILSSIQSDPRYLENLDWGQPRAGHPEGTVRAHITELEQNLTRLATMSEPVVNEDDIARLRILIHTHDTFKPNAKRGVTINDPNSHASLAAKFLSELLRRHKGFLEGMPDKENSLW